MVFPSPAPTLKNARITPNRPISKLTFIHKVFEKWVATQVHNNLIDAQFQPAPASFHSTEPAQLEINNDLVIASDSGLLPKVIQLDLTAASDTISHSTLLDRLSSISITHTPHTWLTTYLFPRTQYIHLKYHKSTPLPVTAGVPQDFVLWPLLFIIYSIFYLLALSSVNINLIFTATRMTSSTASLPNLVHPFHLHPMPSATKNLTRTALQNLCSTNKHPIYSNQTKPFFYFLISINNTCIPPLPLTHPDSFPLLLVCWHAVIFSSGDAIWTTAGHREQTLYTWDFSFILTENVMLLLGNGTNLLIFSSIHPSNF